MTDKKDILHVRIIFLMNKMDFFGIFCIFFPFHKRTMEVSWLQSKIWFDLCKFSFLHFSLAFTRIKVTWTINFVPNTSFHSMENSRFLWKRISNINISWVLFFNIAILVSVVLFLNVFQMETKKEEKKRSTFLTKINYRNCKI